MKPELFAEFCQEFTREMNRMRFASREAIESAESEVKKIDRDLDRLVDMILRGGASDRLNAKMLVMDQRKRDLGAFLAEANEPPPLLHPEIANFYRRQVHQLLQHEPEAGRLKAADMLRA